MKHNRFKVSYFPVLGRFGNSLTFPRKIVSTSAHRPLLSFTRFRRRLPEQHAGHSGRNRLLRSLPFQKVLNCPWTLSHGKEATMRSGLIARSVSPPAPHSLRPLTARGITAMAVFLSLMSLFACSDNPSTPAQAPVQSTRQQCQTRAVFGNPADSEYILPYPVGASYLLLQTYCGPQNHGNDNQLAYDFLIPLGDPVIAVRAGIVRLVTEHFADNDTNRANHNNMFIEHSDGSTAFYAHLVQHSVLPEEGDWVAQGELIAQSGRSGGTVAVLHLGVYCTWPVQGGNDMAINFRNADGPLDERGGLVQGATYTALPY